MVLILVIGLVFDRLDMFIDITIAYAILNFIGNIAIAKYLEIRSYKRSYKKE
jgi:multicomponent Na+:H+ antiporter subunit F